MEGQEMETSAFEQAGLDSFSDRLDKTEATAKKDGVENPDEIKKLFIDGFNLSQENFGAAPGVVNGKEITAEDAYNLAVKNLPAFRAKKEAEDEAAKVVKKNKLQQFVGKFFRKPQDGQRAA